MIDAINQSIEQSNELDQLAIVESVDQLGSGQPIVVRYHLLLTELRRCVQVTVLQSIFDMKLEESRLLELSKSDNAETVYSYRCLELKHRETIRTINMELAKATRLLQLVMAIGKIVPKPIRMLAGSMMAEPDTSQRKPSIQVGVTRPHPLLRKPLDGIDQIIKLDPIEPLTIEQVLEVNHVTLM